jgi:hypothetical protein
VPAVILRPTLSVRLPIVIDLDHADFELLPPIHREVRPVERRQQTGPGSCVNSHAIQPKQRPGQRGQPGNQQVEDRCDVRIQVEQQFASRRPLVRRHPTHPNGSAKRDADQRQGGHPLALGLDRHGAKVGLWGEVL